MFQPLPAALFILTSPYFINEASQMAYSSQDHFKVEDYISITKNMSKQTKVSSGQ